MPSNHVRPMGGVSSINISIVNNTHNNDSCLLCLVYGRTVVVRPTSRSTGSNKAILKQDKSLLGN